MSEDTKPIGRLAMRVEGDKWIAYYALPNTMDDAIWLGSTLMAVVEKDREVRDGFIEVMKKAVSALLASKGHPVAGWGGETRAPESERSGYDD